MSSQQPQLRQIRASAGSGKTYELTTSFLKYLSGAAEAGGGPFSGCSAVHSGPHGWPEILAVTFTNRAAAEMQERIIGRLKDTALGTGKPAPGWTREQARKWVGIILRRYGALNVRTIDSLLHLIVRLTALELDLPPDFEPVFATDEAIAPLLDSLLERSRQDERLHALLDEACRNVFFHSRQRGFLAGEALRERVMELLLPVMGAQAVALAQPSEIADRLGVMTRDLRDAVELLHRLLAEEKLSCSAHLSKALEACRKAAPANLPPNSTMLRKACLDDCLNKASKGKASPDAERAFDAMRDIIRKWDEDGVLLRRAQTVMPFVELARELAGQVPDFLKREGAVPAAFVPRLARQVLSGDYGVPEAFCRLGTSLTHILVDEFQDTSREQWQAIHPLVLEALSRGGSLTWVGDVKQAIYGWRGGDATLFDEVRSDADLCAVAPEPQVDILPTNWRSCRAIVETNNTLFRQLAETATAKAVLSAMLPKETPPPLRDALLEEGAQLLKEGFAGSEQEIAPGKAEGFLRLQRVYGDKGEDLDEEVRSRLLECVQEVTGRRPWGDVTVLVRSNGKAAQVAGWLMEEGIPVVTDNSFLLAEHPLVEQLTALLTFLDSPRNDLAFWTFLSGRQMLLPLIPLSGQELEDWAAARRTSERRNMPLFMAFREDFPDIWRTWIAPFHADAGLLTPYDVTREALGRLGIWNRYPDEAAFVRRFLEIIHVAEGQGYGSLSSFLDYWGKHGQQEKAPMPETLDAVRVMTMHKSKGLQFPVVIVPWHNFSQRVDSPAVETHVDGLTVLAPRGPASGYEHYKAIADNAREALHLLYVAWTRAEEELHAFLTETASSRNASGFGNGLNVLLGALPMTEELFETGTPPSTCPAERNRESGPVQDEDALADEPPLAGPEELPAGQINERWRPMHWLPRLRIFRNPLEEFSFTQKRRGTFAHHCLACLQTAGQLTGHPEEDAREAFRQGLRTFPLPIRDPETVEQELVEMLAWYAALPEAAEWLRYGTPEQELIDESGELFRSDLVADDGKRITVVEYKTGMPTPAHEIQLQRYMRLISKATPRPVRGVLVYLDLKRLDYKQLQT